MNLDEMRQASRRPDAAQRSVRFDQSHAYAPPRGGDGGHDTGRATPSNKNIRRLNHGHVTCRLTKSCHLMFRSPRLQWVDIRFSEQP
jgi:hypothetical protein